MTTTAISPLRVAIIGAGTAGLSAAIAFQRTGHHVEVFEKHETLATLGAGLLIQPQGVLALSALGVGADFSEISVPITLLEGKCHRGWNLVDIPYRGQEARAVSRPALAQILLKAAHDSGAKVNFSANVVGVSAENGIGKICIDGHDRNFDLVVIAGGASSVMPAEAGLSVPSTQYKWGALWGMFDVAEWAKEHVLQQRYRTTRQMYGLMPTERIGGKLRLSFFWSLPCDSYESWKNSSLDDWKKELLDLWPESSPIVSQITSHDQFTFATYRHAWPKKLANSPICVIGDAAHSMSPQLGLGATLAVQDALHLAQQVNAWGLADGLKKFSRKRLRSVYFYQTLSRALTPCFQANSNGLWRDIAFALSLYVPGMRHIMYRSVAEPFSPSSSSYVIQKIAATPTVQSCPESQA